jgi:hypothetical protein
MTTTANAAATPTITAAMTIQMDFTHQLIIKQHPKKHYVSQTGYRSTPILN